KKVWQMLNNKQAKEGKPLFANTRNAAAGSLRQLDPVLAAERHLDFFAWDVIVEEEKKALPTHQAEHQRLRQLGFKVDKHEVIAKDLEQVFKHIDKIEKLRENFPFGTDGV